MVSLMRCVLNGSVDVFPFEEGVVGQNFVEARAVRQKLKNVDPTETLAANARTPPTFSFIDGDSFESVCAHMKSDCF